MTFDTEALADEAPLLRRLAHQLIPDPEAAEDATQEVALAFLEKRPEGLRSARAWLTGALRFERLKWLGRATRRNTPQVDPEQLSETRSSFCEVTSSEIRDLIERETRALREPYGRVVYASLFEDQGLDAIARLLGRPHVTVRSQHKRGIELLRRRLDHQLGSRDSWALMLLPWTGSRASSSEQPAWAAPGNGLRRALPWIALPVATTGLWLFLSSTAPTPWSASDRMVADLDGRGVRSTLAQIEVAGDWRTPAAIPGPGPLQGSDDPLSPASDRSNRTKALEVRVLDQNGTPVRGARILAGVVDAEELQSSIPTGVLAREPGFPAAELGVTDANGHALVEVRGELMSPRPDGLSDTRFRAEAEGCATDQVYFLTWGGTQEVSALTMRVHSAALDVALRFRDGAGNPIGDASAFLVPTSKPYLDNEGDCRVVTNLVVVESAEDGLLRMPPCAPGTFSLSTWSPGRGSEQIPLEIRQDCVIDLVPSSGMPLRGQVLNGEGLPVPGAHVWYELPNFRGPIPWWWLYTVSDSDGRYELFVQATEV